MDITSQNATRDALHRMAEDGSDMSKPMAMDFFIAVPSREAGNDVASEASALGFGTSVEHDDASAEWTGFCQKTIVPALATVIEIEDQLETIAQRHGGFNDGFGSYGNAS
jgi:regulator of RNase E activity RraB